ncbi:hypothetical protein VTO42DRAFT_502 [Malbranchea cinnamomea]
MANANEVPGFLHGFYGLGATVSPLIATAVITNGNLDWYHSYLYCMIPAAAVELLSCVASFWTETGTKLCMNNPKPEGHRTGLMREALSKCITWICALFLFLYVGTEDALGGWIVTFMIAFEREATSSLAWFLRDSGWEILLGRVILVFVTPLLGENLTVSLYVAAGVAMELLFWLVPNFVASALAVVIVGFCLGPLFPAAVVAITKLLSLHLHLGAIGFGATVGGVRCMRTSICSWGTGTGRRGLSPPALHLHNACCDSCPVGFRSTK